MSHKEIIEKNINEAKEKISQLCDQYIREIEKNIQERLRR